MEHRIAFAQENTFAGWPANNGIWMWDGSEILVGCSVGPLKIQPGHNIGEPITSILLRSPDGGNHWTVEHPTNFVGSDRRLAALEEPLDTSVDGFALRITGTGYHGNEYPSGAFYASADRGKTWRGPFRLNGLEQEPELRGLELTPRTDYLIQDSRSTLLFLSARDPLRWGSDKVYCARTDDGGQTFQFTSWVTPWEDPHRAVMPSTVRCDGDRIVSTVRRRSLTSEDCWIDAYCSDDRGISWQFCGTVGETGIENGNPPALARLEDGCLCCVYGNRTRRQMLARFSRDDGKTWRDETVLREDFAALDADADFGYPCLVQRGDGKLVALYYWATQSLPQQHIAVTIF